MYNKLKFVAAPDIIQTKVYRQAEACRTFANLFYSGIELDTHVSALTGTQAARLHGRESVREVLVRIQLEFVQSSPDFLQKSAKQSKRRRCCVPVVSVFPVMPQKKLYELRF
jgi:hypothetical protein